MRWIRAMGNGEVKKKMDICVMTLKKTVGIMKVEM